jgi:hypothetical protein
MHLAFPIEFLSPPLLINLITNFIVTTRKMSGKIETLLLTADQALRRKRTTFSAAEVMDKKKPDSSIRILRI